MQIKLEELDVYNVSMEVGEDIWLVVTNWSYWEKDTLGKQIVRSVDSIALNIAEGYGRYHFKENKNFCFIARGSNIETKTALLKAKNRNLITQDDFNNIMKKLERVHLMLNKYIKSIGSINDQ